MSDVFKTSFQVSVPDGMTLWEATERLTRSAVQLYQRMPGEVSDFSYTLHDESGSRIKRETILAIREAVREYRLKPDRLWGSAYCSVDGEQLWRNALEVDVQGVFWENVDTPIVVRIEGADKMQVDGMEAHLRREAQHLDDQDPLEASGVASSGSGTETAPSQSNVFHGPVNVGAIGNGVSVGRIEHIGPRADVTPEHGFGNWLRRVWRDQTATFLVTVAGTVAAAAIGLWIGLSP